MHTFLSKIKMGKYNTKHLGILFVVGVLLIIISMPTSQEHVEVAEEEENGAVMETNGVTDADYKSELETQLTTILSQVEGVGEVQVMITLQATTEKIVEKDVSTGGDEIEETTIYQEGDAGQEPYISQEIYPTIEGVVVTATGGDNSIVIKNITEAIQALFDVDTHKIKIMKMKSD